MTRKHPATDSTLRGGIQLGLVHDRGVLRACLGGEAADTAATLKRRHLAAHTVQVKVRYRDSTTLTRQITVEEPIAETRDIYRLGCFLLGREQLVR